MRPGLDTLIIIGATSQHSKSVGKELMGSAEIVEKYNVATLGPPGSIERLRGIDGRRLVFYFLKGWTAREDSQDILAFYNSIDALLNGEARLFDPTTNREIKTA